MKRLLFVFSMFAVSMTAFSVQKAAAQTVVTTTSFNSEITQLDIKITAGDTVAAKAIFATINTDMMTVLAVTKTSIHGAVNDSTKNYYTNLLGTQQVPLYQMIWQLKNNMILNHTALIAKLNAFSALIY